MVRESNRSQNIKEESILDQCLQNRGWVLKVSAFFGCSLFTFIAGTCLHVLGGGGGGGGSQVLASIILQFDTSASGSHWHESPECWTSNHRAARETGPQLQCCYPPFALQSDLFTSLVFGITALISQRRCYAYTWYTRSEAIFTQEFHHNSLGGGGGGVKCQAMTCHSHRQADRDSSVCIRLKCCSFSTQLCWTGLFIDALCFPFTDLWRLQSFAGTMMLGHGISSDALCCNQTWTLTSPWPV